MSVHPDELARLAAIAALADLRIWRKTVVGLEEVLVKPAAPGQSLATQGFELVDFHGRAGNQTSSEHIRAEPGPSLSEAFLAALVLVVLAVAILLFLM